MHDCGHCKQDRSTSTGAISAVSGIPGWLEVFLTRRLQRVNRVNGAVVSRGEAVLEVGLEQRSHILLSNDSQVLTHLRNQQWAE